MGQVMDWSCAGRRTRRSVALIVGVLASVFAGCGEEGAEGTDSTDRFGGQVSGRQFQASSATAGPKADGGIVVQLADYPIACSDISSEAHEGARLVALLLSAQAAVPGVHAIPDDPWDLSVMASVTEWIIDDQGELRTGPSTIFSHGTIVLDRVDEQEVSGWADLKVAEEGTVLQGSFVAPRCHP